MAFILFHCFVVVTYICLLTIASFLGSPLTENNVGAKGEPRNEACYLCMQVEEQLFMVTYDCFLCTHKGQWED